MSNPQWEEISKLYSNLAKIAYRIRNYDLALQQAEICAQISETYSTSKKVDIKDTIIQIKAAKCEHLLSIAMSKKKGGEEFRQELSEAQSLLQGIPEEHSTYHKVAKLMIPLQSVGENQDTKNI